MGQQRDSRYDQDLVGWAFAVTDAAPLEGHGSGPARREGTGEGDGTEGHIG